LANIFEINPGGATFFVLLFLAGLMIGVVAKRAVKLAVALVGLVVILTAAGYVATPNPQTIFNVFSQSGGAISQAEQFAMILPVSSAAFLIGLAIGLWKG
jgi:uncharacterized membrane protein (Fun14 family)